MNFKSPAISLKLALGREDLPAVERLASSMSLDVFNRLTRKEKKKLFALRQKALDKGINCGHQ